MSQRWASERRTPNPEPRGRFRAFSAGSHPKGDVNPLALELLAQQRLPTDGLRSKSWDEFAQPDAPVMDFVFTVCDDAAAEQCPVWPGQPITAHWGVADPAAATGSVQEQRRAFLDAFLILKRRIDLLANLPMDKLRGLELQKRLDQIGHTARSEDVWRASQLPVASRA